MCARPIIEGQKKSEACNGQNLHHTAITVCTVSRLCVPEDMSMGCVSVLHHGAAHLHLGDHSRGFRIPAQG